ncbi:hypothetical protein F2981_21105 (plasmid) [Sinorhizobium meliloti]|nr:hypothetical protein [Sinorhizobium meliloti]
MITANGAPRRSVGCDDHRVISCQAKWPEEQCEAYTKNDNGTIIGLMSIAFRKSFAPEVNQRETDGSQRAEDASYRSR